MSKVYNIFIAVFFILLLCSLASADETLTITTYYPSPFGSYNQLTTTGNTYLATASSNNVGIGTSAPGVKLTVRGAGIFDTAGTWSNSSVSAGTDLAVTGNVGIGTTSPNLKLQIDTGNTNYGAILLTRAASKPAFSILPWDSQVYLSAGIYEKNGVWTQFCDTSDNLLFVLDPGVGVTWYASNNGSGSWNVAANITLWNTTGTWVGPSSRTLKESFTRLNDDDILKKIDQLEVTRWNFKSEGKSITHIGPVAEDFYRIFKTGDAENHLTSIDSVGVSLAGVKALSKRLGAQQQQIEQLQREIKDLKLQLKRRR